MFVSLFLFLSEFHTYPVPAIAIGKVLNPVGRIAQSRRHVLLVQTRSCSRRTGHRPLTRSPRNLLVLCENRE